MIQHVLCPVKDIQATIMKNQEKNKTLKIRLLLFASLRQPHDPSSFSSLCKASVRKKDRKMMPMFKKFVSPLSHIKVDSR